MVRKTLHEHVAALPAAGHANNDEPQRLQATIMMTLALVGSKEWQSRTPRMMLGFVRKYWTMTR
jgi:hypothetical protein